MVKLNSDGENENTDAIPSLYNTVLMNGGLVEYSDFVGVTNNSSLFALTNGDGSNFDLENKYTSSP